MSTKYLDQIETAITKGCAELALPSYLVETTAVTSAAVLIGMALLLPELVNDIELTPRQWKQAYRRRPVQHVNPIFFLIGYDPLVDPESTFALAAKIGLSAALQQPGAYRMGFRTFLPFQLARAKNILRKNGMWNQYAPIRGSVVSRFREVWRLLEADNFDGDTSDTQRGSTLDDIRAIWRLLEENNFDGDTYGTQRNSGLVYNKVIVRLLEANNFDGNGYEARRKSALDNVRAIYDLKSKMQGKKRKTEVFPSEDRSSRVAIRPPQTTRDRIFALARVNRRFVERALSYGRLLVPDNEENQPRITNEASLARALKTYARELRAQGRDYPVAIGTPGDLGRAEMFEIMLSCRCLEAPEDILLSLIIFGLWYPNRPSARHIRFMRRGVTCYIQIELRLPQERRSIGRNLYRKAKKRFLWPISDRLFEAVRQLKRSPERALEKAEQNIGVRLREINGEATVAKVIRCLCIHGYAWFGLPWIFPEITFRSRRPKFPAPRSYSHVSPEMVRQAETYMKIFDPTFQCPSRPYGEGTMSTLCPESKVVAGLFHKWQRWFRQFHGFRNVDRALTHWNILVAGMHTLVLMTCGLRNHEMAPLEWSSIKRGGDWEMIHQKGEPFGFWICPEIVRLLHKLHVIWQRLSRFMNSSGVRIADDWQNRYAYGFLGWTGETTATLKYENPSNFRCVQAFVACPAFASYGQLDRKWTRHFANSVLRSASFPELAIRHLHNHHDYMLRPDRRHRIEPLILRSVLHPLVKRLLDECGVVI